MKRSRTWSKTFLAGTVAAGLTISTIIAAVASAVSPGTGERPLIPEPTGFMGLATSEEPPGPEEWLDPWLENESTDFGDVLDAIPWLLNQPGVGGAAALIASLERSLADAPDRALAVLLVRARTAREPALGELRELALDEEPAPRVNLALGLALPLSEARAAAFEREADLHDSDRARRHALDAYVTLRAHDELSRLLADPDYEAVADALIPYRVARQRLDWVGLLIWTGPVQYARVSPLYTALGLVSGLLWLIILAYLGDVRSLKSSRLALCLVAVLLGALSTIPTLVLNVWMEEVLGVRSGASLYEGLAFYIGSVGLREELCKLIAFLPLAPIVIRRGDPREALIVAGCVGLGFAAEENVSYFAASAGGSVTSRFLTANFGHALMTGLIGAWFCRAVTEPKHIQDFLLVSIAMVIGHGVYDALILVPELSEWSAFGATIYVGAALIYFGQLAKCPRVEPRRIPVTAVFVYGLTTMLALGLIASSWSLGFGLALRTIIPGTVGAGLFVFVFLREMNEPLLP